VAITFTIRKPAGRDARGRSPWWPGREHQSVRSPNHRAL